MTDEYEVDQIRTLTPSASGRSRREPQNMTTTVLIEPPRDRPHLAGVRRPVYVWPISRQSNPDDVLAGAEHMRTQFERLYGGHWIILRRETDHS